MHSGWEHLRACIGLARAEGVPDLVLHAFTDGRDTLPDSGAAYVDPTAAAPTGPLVSAGVLSVNELLGTTDYVQHTGMFKFSDDR